MAVSIHEGLPGSGKTLRMLSLIENFIVKDKRSVYLFNFKLTDKGIQYFTALAEQHGVGFHIRPERPSDLNVPFETDKDTGYISLKFLGIGKLAQYGVFPFYYSVVGSLLGYSPQNKVVQIMAGSLLATILSFQYNLYIYSI